MSVGVVPGPSTSVFRSELGNETLYLAIGPFPAGVFVRRLHLFARADAGVITRSFTFGAVVGGSAQAVAGTFAAGLSVISASDVVADTKPVTRWELAAGEIVEAIFPVGVKTQTGANYLILRLSNSDPDGTVAVLVGVEVMRADKGGAAQAG